MRRFVLSVLVVLALVLCAPTARTQGIPVPGSSYGFCYNLTVPQTISASCTVMVYNQGTTTPATGLYSNEGLTVPLASPFTAGQNGSWRFFVAASTTQAYDITISGGLPALTPYTILNVIPGSGGSGGNVKPGATAGIVFVSLQGNDSNDCLSWGTSCLTILGGYNKLPADGGTIYVTSGMQGSGPQCTPTSGQGLGIAGTADPNYASMPELIGSVYWVQAKSGFSGVAIVGVSGNNSNANATTPPVTPVLCGGAAAPAFQFSSVEGYQLQNLGMAYPKQGVLIQVDSNGDQTGTATNSSDIVLENLVINICNSCGATPGPTILLGGNLLWARLSNLALQANSGNATLEGRAAIAFQSNAGTATGLIHMDNINTTFGGNLVWDNDATVGTTSFDVTNWLMEGTGLHVPVIDIEGSTGVVFADVKSVGTSDAGLAPLVHVPASLPPYALHLTGNYGQDAVTIDGPTDLGGLMRQGGISNVAINNKQGVATVAPQGKNETGYPLGRLSNVQTDVGRRQFLSTFSKYTNLASQLPGAWTATSGFVTTTTGQAAPDGSTNAAKVATSSSGGAIAYDATLTFAAGDYLYIGVWARMASTVGVNNASITDSTLCLCFPFGSGPQVKVLGGSYNANGGSVLAASSAPQSDGEWQWLWAIGKVVGSFGSAGVRLQLQAGSSATPMYFYAPVFAKIPSSTLALVAAPTFSSASQSTNTVTMVTTGAHNLSAGEPVMISGCSVSGYNGEQVLLTTPLTTSFTYWVSSTGLSAPTGCVITPGNDSEAADWAQHTGTWAENAPANTLAGPRNIKPSFGGSTNFWGTLTQANTANRTYAFPDAAITVSGLQGYSCGNTSTCTNTGIPAPHVIWGQVALSSGTPSTVTVTGISPAFTSTTSYQCNVTDMTDATKNLLKVVNASTSSFTITGPNTITDTISYICIGN